MHTRAKYTCILINHNGLMSKTFHNWILFILCLIKECSFILTFSNIYLRPVTNYLNNKEL